MAARPLPEADELRKFFRYDSETGNLYRHDSNEPSGWKTSEGYLLSKISGKTWFVHRIIWKMMTGEDPKIIDHINGVTDDNRWINLRSVSDMENSRNRAISVLNTSGVTGVYWHKGQKQWRARIKVKQRYIHVGSFKDFDEAVNARKSAERKYGFHPNHGKRTVNAS